MKLCIIIFCVSVLLLLSGHLRPVSATVLDYKVYEEYGGTYHDAEKSPSIPDDDDNLCWAAAASNVLYWTGWGTPEGETFGSSDDIFGYYRDHWSNLGGSVYYAWDWWFDGDNDMQGVSPWPQVEIAGGGFWEPDYMFADYFDVEFDDDKAWDAMSSALNQGYGVTLTLIGETNHAVTAWGYVYDDQLDLYDVYITDSDDSKDNSSPPDLLQQYDLIYNASGGEYANGGWYLQNYYGYDTYYIVEVMSLGQYPGAQPVPEPGTILLMGLGLSGLIGLRRRRGRPN